VVAGQRPVPEAKVVGSVTCGLSAGGQAVCSQGSPAGKSPRVHHTLAVDEPYAQCHELQDQGTRLPLFGLVAAMPTLSPKARRLLLAGLTVLVVGLVVWVALRGQQLGAVASAVLQGASVVLSVYGAIVFVREGNDKHVRAAARASARRVLINYETLGRLATVIAQLRSRMRVLGEAKGVLDSDLVDMALNGLEDQVFVQILSADAAIQDWRDLAPTEVDAEVNQVRESRERND
jgi:hypothetical protein